MDFWALSKQANNDITFSKFYTSDQITPSLFGGSHETYWWQYMNLALAKNRDGYNWQAFGFSANVIGVA